MPKKKRTKNPAAENLDLSRMDISKPDPQSSTSKMESFNFPRDPGPGKLGKKIRLIANCFPIVLPNGSVYHYDIKIESVKSKEFRKNASKEEQRIITKTSKNENSGSEPKKDRCIGTKRNREIIHYMLKNNIVFEGRLAAYDGRNNLYTRRPLAHIDKICNGEILETDFCEIERDDKGNIFAVVLVTLPPGYFVNKTNPLNEYNVRSKPDRYAVRIQPVKTNGYEISLDSLHDFYTKRTLSVSSEVVMAIETIFRSTPCLQYYPIGRCFFHFPDKNNTCRIEGGKEIWFGHHQSIRLGEKAPLLNMDITGTVFSSKRPLIEHVAMILGIHTRNLHNQIFGRQDITKILKALKPVKIATTHLRYKKVIKVEKLAKNANNQTFEYKDGNNTRVITVAEYFRTKHGVSLLYPSLPCVETKKGECFPMEICEVVPQSCRENLTPSQRTEVIKYTSCDPVSRFKEIHYLLEKANHNNDEYLKEFNIKVGNEPLSLEGRIMECPGVSYKINPIVRPMNGQWDIRGKEYWDGALINVWELVNLSKVDDRKILDLSDKLDYMANQHGIKIQNKICINGKKELCESIRKTGDEKLIWELLSDMKKRGVELAVFVLPDTPKKDSGRDVNSKIYGTIKRISDLQLGIQTQCVREKNISDPKKFNLSLISNICLKINPKMGGINNTLVLGEMPLVLKPYVMVFGADVNHPPPTSEDIRKPSMAALVGSTNRSFTRYTSIVLPQFNPNENKVALESIPDMGKMFKEVFSSREGTDFPEKIIFYRDGVSEGEFGIVVNDEVAAIRRACLEIKPDFKPKLTYIVVQKNHHVRFKPFDRRDGVGKMGNAPPGTVVDREVTHPSHFDFFLYSQFGLQGTSRPAHYTVLVDDNNLSPDDAQKMSYYLSHIFARCPKSISVPAPIRYAHLAAYRARLHVQDGGTNQAPTLHPNVKSSMYYV